MRIRPNLALKLAVAAWMFLICISIVSLFLAMAGCSTMQVPHNVNMAVKTDCHPQPVTHAPWATSSMTPASDIFDQAKLLLAERKQRQDYEAQLEAAAKACQ